MRGNTGPSQEDDGEEDGEEEAGEDEQGQQEEAEGQQQGQQEEAEGSKMAQYGSKRASDAPSWPPRLLKTAEDCSIESPPNRPIESILKPPAKRSADGRPRKRSLRSKILQLVKKGAAPRDDYSHGWENSGFSQP